MPKNFRLRADQIKPLANGHGHCLASDMITVEGLKVGYMYRQEPRDETDSGWVFTSGREAQGYMDDPKNLCVYDVNIIANYDPEIIPFLDAPIGSALARNADSGEFEPEFGPEEDEPLDPGGLNRPDADQFTKERLLPAVTGPIQSASLEDAPEFCDDCGMPLEPGEEVLRSCSNRDGQSYSLIHLALCPKCARQYDGQGDHMILGMGVFAAIVVILGLAGWLLSWANH
jgi:hypothetical protein